MSRIGKMPIPVPAGVEVKITDVHTVTVKGKLGELTKTFNLHTSITLEGDEIIVTRNEETREARALHGLTRTLIHNMVVGVSEGYEKKLEIVGVGYRALMKGKNLELSLGFSHPVVIEPEPNITFEAPEATKITVKGIDKQRVGQVAADIRKWRKPEPYKGKGIRYEGEHVRRKLGKAAK